ncbi:hypothetical protein B7P43_G16978 [Cryptotermes secundus]|uniref:Uncharacterized protein n=1 Tax=Cryptotermes secundus TaxID=105785 RepID=A0A2J7PFB8_9NEOP|nr:hypothetical protein B7P43_G16978 [Cryptotermes secundus]
MQSALGHLTTTTATQDEGRAMELNLQNRRMMVDKTAKQLNINNGSICSVVHNNLSSMKCVPGEYLRN